MRLSSRALNNIIILSMLAMVLLFNIDQWLPKPSSIAQTHLINQQDMLLRMDIGKKRIERAGTDWRLSGSGIAEGKLPEDIIEQWHIATLSEVEEFPEVIEQTDVNLWLATYNEPVQLILMRAGDSTYVQIADRLYLVSDTDYASLLF